jgi:DNA-binding protein H-NS
METVGSQYHSLRQVALAAVRTLMQLPANDRRPAPARPKYRSRKHKRFTWSGRGLMPRWMVEEMKGTKLTKEDFLIK